MSNRPTVKATVPPPKKRRGPVASTLAKEPAGGSQRTWWIVIGVVVVIGVAVVLAALNGSNGNSSTGSTSPATNAALVAKVTSVKPAVFDAVGAGTTSGTINPIKGQSALVSGGKPRVVYIGAEYCPYCATERWAMVLALSRFGTFSKLGVTHSSGSDVFPNTPTFSFHGSTFTSQYLVFDGIETLSNVPQGSSYAPLDTPTREESALIDKFDAPPFVSSDSAGSIPFIDLGNRYVVSGATYDPQVLQGRSAAQIAVALSDTSSDISKGAVGSANVLTAAICDLTRNQPSAVCTSKGVTSASSKLRG